MVQTLWSKQGAEKNRAAKRKKYGNAAGTRRQDTEDAVSSPTSPTPAKAPEGKPAYVPPQVPTLTSKPMQPQARVIPAIFAPAPGKTSEGDKK